MTLRDILNVSIPEEPGYRAPQASRPVDDPLPDYDAPRPIVPHRSPPLGALCIEAVREFGVASTAEVVAWLSERPEAAYSARTTAPYVTRLLRAAERRGAVHQLPTGAWTPGAKKR